METLTEVKNKVERLDTNKDDFLVRVEDIKVDNKGTVSIRDGISQTNHQLTDFALRQLITKIRGLTGLGAGTMKVQYLKECSKESMAFQLNDWMDRYLSQNESPEWLVRLKDGNIRAILSDSYATFDNLEVVNLLENYVNETGQNLEFEKAYINENNIFLRTVDNDLKIGEGVGELSGGWHLSNSEIGTSSVKVEFLIFQLVCTNGMISPFKTGQFFKQRHYGVDEEKVRRKFVASLSSIDKNEARKTLELFNNTQDIVFDIPQEPLYNNIRKNYACISKDIAEDAQTRLHKYNNTQSGISKFSLISSITEVARDIGGEKRYKIEKDAGKILKDNLEDNVNQWREQYFAEQEVIDVA